jgi:hypothetical protein
MWGLSLRTIRRAAWSSSGASANRELSVRGWGDREERGRSAEMDLPILDM